MNSVYASPDVRTKCKRAFHSTLAACSGNGFVVSQSVCHLVAATICVVKTGLSVDEALQSPLFFCGLANCLLLVLTGCDSVGISRPRVCNGLFSIRVCADTSRYQHGQARSQIIK